jgi:hypothetical protein
MNAAFLEALTIVLREGLEAILVLSALAAYLARAGAKNRLNALWFGAAVALLASIVAAWTFERFYNGVHSDIFEGVVILCIPCRSTCVLRGCARRRRERPIPACSRENKWWMDRGVDVGDCRGFLATCGSVRDHRDHFAPTAPASGILGHVVIPVRDGPEVRR